MANELEVRRDTMTALESYRESFGAAAVDTTAWRAYCGRIAELVATTPAFRDADTASKLQICRRIAATNLWPGLGTDGEAYVVKYGSGAAYVVGPRGWVSLLYRAGAKRVTVACVHDGDTFDPGSLIPPTPPRLVPSADPKRSGKPFTHAVAFVEWADGTTDFAAVDRSEIDRVMKSSPAGDRGPWGKWPEKMAQKVALRVLARNVSRRIEMPDDARAALVHAVETDGDEVALVPDDDPTPDGGVTEDTRPPIPQDVPKRTRKTREKPGAAPGASADSSPQQTPPPVEPSVDGETRSPAPAPEESLEVRTAKSIADTVGKMGAEARTEWVNEFDYFPDADEILAAFARIGIDEVKKAARAFVDARKK